MLELTEEESREIPSVRELAINLALHELLSAATDLFIARPDLRELKVEKQEDGVWVMLPDGSKHALPLDDHEERSGY